MRVRLRPHDAGRLRPRVSVRGDGVANRRLRVPSVRVRAGLARLTVEKRAAATFTRRGATVRYRIVVATARNAATASSVRVCDTPGTGLRLRSASSGGRLRDGRACWRIGKLAPGHKRVLWPPRA